MQSTYQPKDIESRHYQRWEDQQYFDAMNNQAASDAFAMVIPPPNVTGHLHMGHGFQDTIMDILARYQRMLGKQTLWQPGTDHAGIATQMVVERQLQAQGKDRESMGRDAFTQAVWHWKAQSGNHITQQIRRLGASVDWSRERFTMDDALSAVVRDTFIQLYDEGLIYRGKRLVNWDPKLHTAISDLEVLNEEEAGHLWYIRYPMVTGDTSVIIATTRPETLLGDVAVAVHPEDPRYQSLIGQYIALPLTDRTIPIITDDYVDPDFGTGCVKITPAHDFNDYDMGKRHDLPMINIMTPDAHLNEHVTSEFQGLERYAARKAVLGRLEALGLLVKTEPHTLKVPRGDRSGVVIEPMLTNQWYVKTKPLAEPALEAVKQGQLIFTPSNWTKTYNRWLEDIQDWCISRQLWWGHRIPAWYDDQNTIYVGQNEQQIREKYDIPTHVTLRQDEDVLDTWFSAALWPFSTLGWPEQSSLFERFYPTNVLVTGFDIIFFWVARMVMMGLKLTGKVPFKQVYVTGLIRDAEGQKMSKSKGNVLDPIDLIDGISLDELIAKRTQSMMQPHLKEKITKQTQKQFPKGISASGTDALRFTFCALASNNRDIRFDIQRLEGYRNFCNKLWNATRFILMNTEAYKPEATPTLTLADRWIQSQLQGLIQATHRHLEQFRFDLLAQALYQFVWHDYCDWYVELSKPILYSDQYGDEEKQGVRHTLLTVLETVLRLLHPIMPFITEEIWLQLHDRLPLTGDTLMYAPFPQAEPKHINEMVEQEMTWVQSVIIAIRSTRAEMQISPAKTIPVILYDGNAEDQQRLNTHQHYLATLAKCNSITWAEEANTLPACATTLVGAMKIAIPLAGLINLEQELTRLNKMLEDTAKEIQRIENKLDNPAFVDKAPAAIVTKTREQYADYQKQYTELQLQVEKIQAID